MIDPLGIPTLNKKCESIKNRERKEDSVIDLKLELENLIQFLNRRNGHEGHNKPLNMNLAVAVTKCDEFQTQLNTELLTALGQVHVRGQSRPNLKVLDKISHLFQKWLQNVEDGKDSVIHPFMSTAKSFFKNVGYFPISSLGIQPKKRMKKVREHVSSSGAFTPGQALDNNDYENKQYSNKGSEFKEVEREVWTYDGEVDPKYLDYPILWLYSKK